jgi:PPM family protein phosphatase
MSITKSLYNFSFGNVSDVGKIRQANEDYFGSFDTANGYVFTVCDGMGGHVGGAKASQLAVQTIRDYLTQNAITNPVESISNALITANEAILKYAEDFPELRGMGTTCVLILVQGSDVYFAHVGDSRIYLFSDKDLVRLTKDHSFVQNMVDAGVMTEEEAEKHPRKNEITNALGLKNMRPPTVGTAPVKAAKGDIFLLCSDGLTGMVGDTDIERVLNMKEGDLQSKANILVRMALEAGGLDNVTLQLVGFNTSPYKKTIAPKMEPANNSKQKFTKKKYITLIAILLASILVLAGLLMIHPRSFLHLKKTNTPMPDTTLKVMPTDPDTATFKIMNKADSSKNKVLPPKEVVSVPKSPADTTKIKSKPSSNTKVSTKKTAPATDAKKPKTPAEPTPTSSKPVAA